MGRRRVAGPTITLFSFQDIITSVTGIMILVTLMMAVELIQRRQQASAQPVVSSPISSQPAGEQTAQEIGDLRTRLESQREALKQLAEIVPGQTAGQIRELDKVMQRLDAEAAQLQGRYESVRRTHEDAGRPLARQTDDLRKTEERIRELEELVKQVSSEKRVVYNAVDGNLKQAWLVELAGDRMLVAALGKPDKPEVFAGVSRQADFRAWAAKRDKHREYFVLLVKPSSISAYKQARTDLTELGFDLGYDLLAADQTAIDTRTGVADR